MRVSQFKIMRMAQQPDDKGGYMYIPVEVTKASGDISIAGGISLERAKQRGMSITHQISVPFHLDIRIGDEIIVGEKTIRVSMIENPNNSLLLKYVYGIAVA